jgi:DNA-binding PadR family transcriptional regulator
MQIDKGLLGGSTTLLLLSLLSESDKYGYEIIKELEQRTDKTFQFKEGTLYPVLHKLENSGYVKSYMAKGETGKERKYYQITKNGIRQLAEEKNNWKVFSVSVNKVLGGEVRAFA